VEALHARWARRTLLPPCLWYCDWRRVRVYVLRVMRLATLHDALRSAAAAGAATATTAIPTSHDPTAIMSTGASDATFDRASPSPRRRATVSSRRATEATAAALYAGGVCSSLVAPFAAQAVQDGLLLAAPGTFDVVPLDITPADQILPIIGDAPLALLLLAFGLAPYNVHHYRALALTQEALTQRASGSHSSAAGVTVSGGNESCPVLATGISSYPGISPVAPL
jgi:hypothetical protein